MVTRTKMIFFSVPIASPPPRPRRHPNRRGTRRVDRTGSGSHRNPPGCGCKAVVVVVIVVTAVRRLLLPVTLAGPLVGGSVARIEISVVLVAISISVPRGRPPGGVIGPAIGGPATVSTVMVVVSTVVRT